MNELGEWLVRAREARGLTLEDAERDTRISRRYLQALETGELDAIPAPVYARGFLRSYAQYLGLNPQEAMERYPRDDGPPALSPARRQAPAPRQPAPEPDETVGQRQNRPTWRRPGPTAPPSARTAAAMPPPVRDQAPPPDPRRRPPPEPDYFEPEPEYQEPTIGVDIGVPVPARRLQSDPASQTRSMAVLIVAVVAIGIILALAFAISQLGGGDDDTGLSPGISDDIDIEGGLPDLPDDGDPAPDDGDPAPTGNGDPVGSGIVPNVEGDSLDFAIQAIEDAGLQPNIRYEPHDGTPDIVLTQSPAPGTQREPGEHVTIIVSEEP